MGGIEGLMGGEGGWAAVMIDDRASIGNHLLYNHHPPGGYEPFTLARAAPMICATITRSKYLLQVLSTKPSLYGVC